MCVDNIPGKTEELRKRHKGVFTAYKVLHSPQYAAQRYNKNNAIVGSYRYKPGINLARKRNGEFIGLDYQYNHSFPSGIHVYLSKKHAMLQNRKFIMTDNGKTKVINCIGKTRVLVAVTVDIDHLIISDGEQAAFRAIYISPEQWKAAGFKS